MVARVWIKGSITLSPKLREMAPWVAIQQYVGGHILQISWTVTVITSYGLGKRGGHGCCCCLMFASLWSHLRFGRLRQWGGTIGRVRLVIPITHRGWLVTPPTRPARQGREVVFLFGPWTRIVYETRVTTRKMLGNQYFIEKIKSSSCGIYKFQLERRENHFLILLSTGAELAGVRYFLRTLLNYYEHHTNGNNVA